MQALLSENAQPITPTHRLLRLIEAGSVAQISPVAE
jgi:hypothetical protein